MELKTVEDQANHQVKNPPQRLKQLKQELKKEYDTPSNRIKKSIASMKKNVEGLQKKEQPDQSRIQELQNVLNRYEGQVAELEQGKRQDARTKELLKLLKIQNGAEEMVKTIGEYRKSKKPQGPLHYTWVRAIEAYSGCRYRQMFGGFNLSNSNCIDVLEVFPKIGKAMLRVYVNDQERQKKVEKLVAKFTDIGSYLLKIAKIFKSQKKLGRLEHNKLLYAVMGHSKAWRRKCGIPAFDNKKVWNILHNIEYHTIIFARHWMNVGRFSEEGFESYHPFLNALFNSLKTVHGTENKIRVLSRRLYLLSDEEVQTLEAVVKADHTGEKRAPYSRTNFITRLEAKGPARVARVLAHDESGDHLVTSNDKMIPEAWKSVYLAVQHNLAPADWHQSFVEDESLGPEVTANMEYMIVKNDN